MLGLNFVLQNFLDPYCVQVKSIKFKLNVKRLFVRSKNCNRSLVKANLWLLKSITSLLLWTIRLVFMLLFDCIRETVRVWSYSRLHNVKLLLNAWIYQVNRELRRISSDFQRLRRNILQAAVCLEIFTIQIHEERMRSRVLNGNAQRN